MPFSKLSMLLLALTTAFAQEPRIDRMLNELQHVQTLSSVSISPDGRWVAWMEPASESNEKNVIHLLDWRDSSAKPERVTASSGTAFFDQSGLAWSPDGAQVAFFSETGSGQKQIFVAAPGGAKAHALASVHGRITDLRWSPDGKQLAFLYAEHGEGAGPLAAVPAQTGAIGTDIHNQRIAIVSAKGGDIRQVSPASLNVYEYDWSPDGKYFAAIAAPGPADNNWWIAQLYKVTIGSGQMESLYRPPAEQQLAVPRWSPDVRQIAFIGGLMSDQGFNGGDIFVMESSGGKPRNVTSGRKSTPNWLDWRGKQSLIVTEYVDGGTAISTLQLDTGKSEMLWKGPQQLYNAGNFPNFSLAKDGRTSALVRTSWQQPPEIWAGPIGGWRQLTHANSAQRSHWGKAESVIWDNQGYRLQGWLIYPDHFDSAKRYPMIVEVHGGPSNIKTAAWPTVHFDMSVMAGLGYFVFFPNPRGSYGEGEAFTRANVKDFGGGDLRDILAGVDAVLKKAPVDDHRIGLTGWSYGGFMTMWTVTQSNRFRAAVAGAGIADWLSYYGENSIDEWMIPFFGASVYDDPAVYAKSSPITYIKQVKTPTLVLVGERDGECPAPQSFEFWHALKTLRVPTQLVVYPGEGHGFHEPKHNLDRMRRTLEWFDHYLGKQRADAGAGGR
jgi:dipeptidyl aminopeptidase/acylaminoacyl peptidase